MFATHLASLAPLATDGFDPTWQTVFLAALVGVIVIAASWLMTQKKSSGD